MNHAQMEGFQYLLQSVNNLGKPNYSLLFSYKGFLLTGKFYKESKESMPSGIQNLQLTKDVDIPRWYKEKEINKSYLLFQLINEQPAQKKFQEYDVSQNLRNPEILFLEISRLACILKGKPVSQFIYDVKDKKTGIELPFIMTDPNDIFEPVSLIEIKKEDANQ